MFPLSALNKTLPCFAGALPLQRFVLPCRLFQASCEAGLELLTESHCMKSLIRGMERVRGKTDTRRPLTLTIMKRLFRYWKQVQTSFEYCTMSSITSTAFFGFFRLGELCAPRKKMRGVSFKLTALKVPKMGLT